MAWYPDPDNPAGSTRNPPPPTSGHTRLMSGFSFKQHEMSFAMHEGGHICAMLEAGIIVHSARISRIRTEADLTAQRAMGSTDKKVTNCPLGSHLVALAAGERAEDRWMRENGLWTPVRAWAAEQHARGDREEIAAALKKYKGKPLTFGVDRTASNDLHTIHDAADEYLDGVWPMVRSVGEALFRRGELTGSAAASVAGF